MNIKSNKKKLIDALIGVASIFIMWEILPYIFKIEPTHLPPFHTVFMSFIDNSNMIGVTIMDTLFEISLAFLISILITFIFAVLMEEIKWIESILLYPTIVLQNIPKVALVPLLIIWCGYGMLPKIVMGILVAFFPILENFRNGLSNNASKLRSTLSVLSPSSRFLLLFKVKIPEAVPNIIIGLKIGITYSVIGVIVGEISHPERGLGRLIKLAENDFDTNLLFASILAASLLGLVLYGVVGLLAFRFLKKYEKVSY